MVQLSNNLCDTESKFLSTLSEKQQKIFLKYSDLVVKYESEALENSLVYGFNFAISIIKELLNH